MHNVTAPCETIENIAVKMIRPHLCEILEAPMPAGFRIRGMTPRDIPTWTLIERDAEPFLTIGDDLFVKEFGHDLAALPERCYFIETETGEPAATISAWYDVAERGVNPGRIHWVATRPAYQRRGLARAGLSYALNRLADWHDLALLGTSTGRLGAIQLYLDFGFVPDMNASRAEEAWAQVRGQLQHAALAQ